MGTKLGLYLIVQQLVPLPLMNKKGEAGGKKPGTREKAVKEAEKTINWVNFPTFAVSVRSLLRPRETGSHGWFLFRNHN